MHTWRCRAAQGSSHMEGCTYASIDSSSLSPPLQPNSSWEDTLQKQPEAARELASEAESMMLPQELTPGVAVIHPPALLQGVAAEEETPCQAFCHNGEHHCQKLFDGDLFYSGKHSKEHHCALFVFKSLQSNLQQALTYLHTDVVTNAAVFLSLLCDLSLCTTSILSKNHNIAASPKYFLACHRPAYRVGGLVCSQLYDHTNFIMLMRLPVTAQEAAAELRETQVSE